MKLVSLDEQYKLYLNNFKKDRVHPHPSKLLALLLLPDKDKYLSLTGNLEEFYDYYYDEINNKINQIMNDFDLEDEDIMEYAYILDIEDNIDYKKQVFANGVIALLWGIMFCQNLSPEETYDVFCSRYFRNECIVKYKKNTKMRLYNKRKRMISTITTGFKF